LFGSRIELSQQRDRLIEKLEEENETKLAVKLRNCGRPFRLICQSCTAQHEVETKCCRKWCPVCAAALARKRSQKLTHAVDRMKWPLFVTLTMSNVQNEDIEFDFIRHLRRAFGKLRHRRLWKENVAGGAAAIELTNTGKGWHPHVHAVIDCQWLSIRTPPPYKRESAASVAAKCRAAAAELTATWGKCLGQVRPPQIKVKRAEPTIAKEIMKYAVKPADLLDSPDAIGPILRMMDGTRLITTFGTLFGMKVPDDLDKPRLQCTCGEPDWMPYDAFCRRADEQHAREKRTRRKVVFAQGRK
jgi:hypothetical protein